MKIQKKKIRGGVGGGVRVGLGGQSGSERRIEVFVKIQKKIIFFWGVGVGVGGGSVGGVGVGLGGQSGCGGSVGGVGLGGGGSGWM